MATREEIREGLLGYLGCPLEAPPYESWNCEHWDKQYGCNRCPLKIPTANYILSYLHSQGVVIKVDRELPENPFDEDINGDWESKEEETYYVGKSNGFETCKSLIIKAGYVAVEPLMEGEA